MSFCFSGGALGSTDSRGRLSRNSLIRRAASACNFARASAEAVSTGSDCCICGDIFIIVCKDVAPDVAIITQYSTTFGLEVTYGKAFKPPAARGEEERISGAFGFDTIMACICRDESRNRTAPSSDDNFVARLDPIQQSAQALSCVRSAGLAVCGICHDICPCPTQ